METGKDIFFKILSHGIVCTFLLSGVLLWMRRRTGDKSRIYLAVTFFLTGILYSKRLLFYYTDLSNTPTVLPIVTLYFGLVALLLLYFYPIEVISPGWLTFRRGILLFAPCWLLGLLLLCVPIHFRVLYSFSDLKEHITEFNVWFRLAILFLCIVPYCLLLFYIPYNYKRSSADYRWIFNYTVANMGIGVFCIPLLLTGSLTISIAHVTYYILFGLFITYQELYLRIAVPTEPKATAEAKPLPVITAQTDGKENDNPLSERLKELMDREQPWRNPNFSLEELAAQLNTDQAALSLIIRQDGYENDKDFINRYRIDGFLEMVNDGNIKNIQDAFFQSGFRSKTTALRYFKKYTGTTPMDYIQRDNDANDTHTLKK